MQLSHLRYIQAIARHGSLSAAARALKVSQPALTGAIKTLEEEFHTTLLLRGRDGITLTEAGSTLLRHARVILAQVETLEHEIRGIGGSWFGWTPDGFAWQRDWFDLGSTATTFLEIAGSGKAPPGLLATRVRSRQPVSGSDTRSNPSRRDSS